MKVNLFTTENRKSQGSEIITMKKVKYSTYLSMPQAISCDSFSPSFEGAASKINKAKTIAGSVIKTGKWKLNSKKPIASIVQMIKDEWEGPIAKAELLTPIKIMKRFINEETCSYVNALLERVGENGIDCVPSNLISVSRLAETYKKHPKARGLMHLALEAEGKEPKTYQFGLSEMERYVFGRHYGGQDYQNTLIESLITSKKCSAKAISNILETYTPSKQEALDMLAVKYTMHLPEISKEELAELVRSVPKSKIKTVIKASFPLEKSYLMEGDCLGIGDLLKYYTPDKSPALKLLLANADMEIYEMAEVFKFYKPKDYKILEKMLYVEDDGGGEFFSSLDIIDVLKDQRRIEKLKHKKR